MLKRTLILFALCILMVSSTHTKVMAASCTTGQYGSVTIQVPALPSRGTYTVWTRLQAPDETHNRFMLEINGSTCFYVGGSSITPKQWVWVAFQDGILSNKVKYNFEHTTENTLKLIGSDAGVKLDRVLILKNDCVPENLGENCQSQSTRVNAADMAGASEIPPPNGPVSGSLIVSPTVQRDPNVIEKVIYFADGTQLPSSNNFLLDTTLLENGSHRIAMQITRLNGSVVQETTTLQVQNRQTVMSPLVRWARIHAQTAVIGSSVLGVVLIGLAVILIVRHIRLQRRLLTFRGF